MYIYTSIVILDIKGYTIGGSIHVIANNSMTLHVFVDIGIGIDVDIYTI